MYTNTPHTYGLPTVTCRMTGSAHRLAESMAQQSQAKALKRQAMQDKALADWHRKLANGFTSHGKAREL